MAGNVIHDLAGKTGESYLICKDNIIYDITNNKETVLFRWKKQTWIFERIKVLKKKTRIIARVKCEAEAKEEEEKWISIKRHNSFKNLKCPKQSNKVPRDIAESSAGVKYYPFKYQVFVKKHGIFSKFKTVLQEPDCAEHTNTCLVLSEIASKQLVAYNDNGEHLWTLNRCAVNRIVKLPHKPGFLASTETGIYRYTNKVR